MSDLNKNENIGIINKEQKEFNNNLKNGNVDKEKTNIQTNLINEKLKNESESDEPPWFDEDRAETKLITYKINDENETDLKRDKKEEKKYNQKMQREKIKSDAEIDRINKHYIIGEQLRNMFINIDNVCENLPRKHIRKLQILENNIIEATKYAYKANYYEDALAKVNFIDNARASLDVCDSIIFDFMENKILPKKKLGTIAYKVSNVRRMLKNYKISILKKENKAIVKDDELSNENDGLNGKNNELSGKNEDLNGKNNELSSKNEDLNGNESLSNKKQFYEDIKKAEKEQEEINKDLDFIKNLI